MTRKYLLPLSTQLTTAERIVNNDGDCAGILCRECPLARINNTDGKSPCRDSADLARSLTDNKIEKDSGTGYMQMLDCMDYMQMLHCITFIRENS